MTVFVFREAFFRSFTKSLTSLLIGNYDSLSLSDFNFFQLNIFFHCCRIWTFLPGRYTTLCFITSVSLVKINLVYIQHIVNFIHFFLDQNNMCRWDWLIWETSCEALTFQIRQAKKVTLIYSLKDSIMVFLEKMLQICYTFIMFIFVQNYLSETQLQLTAGSLTGQPCKSTCSFAAKITGKIIFFVTMRTLD